MQTTKNKTYRLAIRAILIALIILQATIPMLGYIPIFGIISITTLHITVIIAACVLGPKDGMLIGLAWGLCTLVRANIAPTSIMDTLVFRNPLVSVVPRIIVGLVAGLVFRFGYRRLSSVSTASILAAALATLTNTVLVLGSMALLYTDVVAKQYNVAPTHLFAPLSAVVVTNGLPELLLACFLTPLIVSAIFKATNLEKNLRK